MNNKHITTEQLSAYCHHFLQVDLFKDYCPNGLQVQGKHKLSKIITGVTASQALINAAIDEQADALIVHHGFFWKGEDPEIIGIKYNRIKALIENNINLLAYHLPLDAHPIVGNNIQLSKALKLKNLSTFGNQQLAVIGQTKTISGTKLALKLEKILARKSLHIDCTKKIKKIALCTGAAQSYIEDAIKQGADAFISGEISENTVHVAQENKIHYYAAGHHATERFGVKALARHLTKHFGINCQFIDCDNPV